MYACLCVCVQPYCLLDASWNELVGMCLVLVYGICICFYNHGWSIDGFWNDKLIWVLHVGAYRKSCWRIWIMARRGLRKNSFMFVLISVDLHLNAMVCFFFSILVCIFCFYFELLVDLFVLRCKTETFPSIGRVRVKHQGILLTLKGTVIRSGAIKMYEGERMYRCQKCKHE